MNPVFFLWWVGYAASIGFLIHSDILKRGSVPWWYVLLCVVFWPVHLGFELASAFESLRKLAPANEDE